MRPQQSPIAAVPLVSPTGLAVPPPVPSPADISALNMNVPPVAPPPLPNIGRDREAQLLRRIRELEDELRGVRAENEKQVRRSR